MDQASGCSICVGHNRVRLAVREAAGSPIGKARERQGAGRTGAGDPAQGGGAEGRRSGAGRDPAAPALPDEGPDADGGRVSDQPDRLPRPAGAAASCRERGPRSRGLPRPGGRGRARPGTEIAAGKEPTARRVLTATRHHASAALMAARGEIRTPFDLCYPAGPRENSPRLQVRRWLSSACISNPRWRLRRRAASLYLCRFPPPRRCGGQPRS